MRMGELIFMKAKDITQIALMTAVIVVLGLFPGIPLGFIPVPIVLQNMGVMLAGALLGPKKGTMSVALFLILVAVGMPFMSGGHGGIATFMAPSAGYVIAWLFTPLLIGLFEQRFNPDHKAVLQFVFIWLFGVLFIDGVGAIWLAFSTHISIGSSLVANLAFIPGDSVKTVATLAVAQALLRNKTVAAQLQ